MKKLCIVIMILGLWLSGIVKTDAQTPRSIVGASGECDTTNVGCQPIPLTLTTLCTVSCVLNTRPSYTNVNRMWGGLSSCKTSIDGGVTWGDCTTQPFSSGGKESYAGTADGSVIGTARVGVDCFIKKSIDNGTSWATKFTAAGEACGGGTTGPTWVSCFFDGSCVFVYKNASDLGKVVRSTDNGESWSTIFTGVASTRLIQASSYASPNSVVVQAEGVGWRNVSGSSSSYINSVAWAAGSSCWGAYILNGTAFGVCYSGAGSIYQIRNSLTGALVFSPTLPGAIALGNVGGVALGYGSSVVYTLATWQPVSGLAPIGIYVSRDSGATYTLLGLSNVTVNSMREGDFWAHPTNGCLYFSAGLTPMFGKIC